jgi:hypothetical protein
MREVRDEGYGRRIGTTSGNQVHMRLSSLEKGEAAGRKADQSRLVELFGDRRKRRVSLESRLTTQNIGSLVSVS